MHTTPVASVGTPATPTRTHTLHGVVVGAGTVRVSTTHAYCVNATVALAGDQPRTISQPLHALALLPTGTGHAAGALADIKAKQLKAGTPVTLHARRISCVASTNTPTPYPTPAAQSAPRLLIVCELIQP